MNNLRANVAKAWANLEIDEQKLSFILCVQLNLGMKLLAVAFVCFLMQTCTEQQGGGGV